MKNSTTVLFDYITSQGWAMDYSILQQMTDIVERHFNGVDLTAEKIEPIVAARDAKSKGRTTFEINSRGAAIIPVTGVIAKYSSMVNGCSQPRGTSIEQLREQLNVAVTDSRVESIFLHIESPGGCINGLADFADEVYQAGFQKPVVAFCDDLCASAAYWLASQANVIYANQTADVGSIGIYSILVDSSARAEQLGYKFHIIKTGN